MLYSADYTPAEALPERGNYPVRCAYIRFYCDGGNVDYVDMFHVVLIETIERGKLK